MGFIYFLNNVHMYLLVHQKVQTMTYFVKLLNINLCDFEAMKRAK